MLPLIGLLIWSTGMAILAAIIFQDEKRKWAQIVAVVFVLVMIFTMCFSCVGIMTGGREGTP